MSQPQCKVFVWYINHIVYYKQNEMESSFLEDLLKREVDQNQVNALVGSLENQLTTPRSTPTPSAVIKSVNTPKNVLYNNLAPLSNAPVPATQNGIRNVSSVATPMQINGQMDYKNICSIGQSISQEGLALPLTLSNSRANMSLMSNNVSSQVSIAPKITNTVNIAPRLGANIMITPRQIFMAQRFASNALINNNLITRMPGNIQVVPRVPAGTQIPIPPVMNTQIHNIRTVDPNNLNDLRMRMNSPVNPTSLTQIKANNPAPPCQVNYRFRAPNSNDGNAAPPTSNVSNLQNNNANITIMKESVKRLKEFFQNLINLACAPNQPPEIGKMVKELVHNLMVS